MTDTFKFHRGIGAVAMNGKVEIWSLPWHAMQGRLAKGVWAESAARTATSVRGSGARVAEVPATSWLARARSMGPLPSASRSS